MPASVVFTCRIRKPSGSMWRPKSPVLFAPERRVETGKWMVVTGIPVDASGTQLEMDLNSAMVNALLAMERYLVDERCLSRSQTHVVMSVAVDLEILEAVNKPNVLVGAAIDTDIFD